MSPARQRAAATAAAPPGPAASPFPVGAPVITPGRFDSQVVIVTGAAQGIGNTVARRLAAEGAALHLVDRSDLVHEVAAELDGASGGKVSSNTADLETWEGAESSIAAALQQHRRIDVQVNNVGGTIWAKPFHEYDPEQIQAEIDRSLFPTLWSCRAVIPHMIKRRAGVIVNVSSVATRGLNRVPYGAAKGGVNSITKNLAWELAEYGIRVCASAPGGTDAPPRKVARGPSARGRKEKLWYETLVEQTISSSLMHRYGSLDEQAAVITFLASPEASYLTGVIVPVGGGDLGG